MNVKKNEESDFLKPFTNNLEIQNNDCKNGN